MDHPSTTPTVTEADVAAFMLAALEKTGPGHLMVSAVNSYGREPSVYWTHYRPDIPTADTPDAPTLEELLAKLAEFNPEAQRQRQIAECRQRLAELEGRADAMIKEREATP